MRLNFYNLRNKFQISNKKYSFSLRDTFCIRIPQMDFMKEKNY